MQKVLIYLFSGTGNTKRVIDVYKKCFEQRQVETTIFPIQADCNNNIDMTQYDYVGFAYPVHAFNAPKIVLDFVKQLPKNHGKKYFIVKTSGEPLSLNNMSSNKLARVLKSKGYVFCNEYHYVMPYNMIFRHDDGMAAKMYNAVKVLSPYDVDDILTLKVHKKKNFFCGNFLAWLFRIEHIAMKFNGKAFKVSQDRCIDCGKCYRNCPAKNINYSDNKFSFGNQCIMCARCSFHCPTNAINIGILSGWKVNGEYDFGAEERMQEGKHAKYCKKSYEEYFSRVEKLINPNSERIC